VGCKIDRTVEDIVNLEPYHMLVKTSAGKDAMPAFKMRALTPLRACDEGQAAFVRESTFNLHCHEASKREDIDAEIEARRRLEGCEEVCAGAKMGAAGGGKKTPGSEKKWRPKGTQRA
jgi:hypothetical protein